MTVLIDDYKGKDLNKEQKQARKDMEESMKGSDDKVYDLSFVVPKEEKEIYRWFIEEFKTTKLLSNIDLPLIEQLSFSLAQINIAKADIRNRGHYVNDKINPSVGIYDKFSIQFKNLCTELGCSPKARGSIAKTRVDMKEQAQDPLMQLMNELKN